MPLFALLWFMGILTALLTAFYMFRMMWLAFYGKARSDHAEHAHESPPVMTVPLLILAVFAVVSGLWLVVNLYGGFGHLVTEPLTHYKIAFEVEAPSTVLGAILTSPLTYVSLAVAAAGIWLARRRYHAGLPAGEEATPSRGWRGLLYNRYYVTQAIYEPLGNTVAYGIAKLSAWFDRVGIDGAVNGIARRTDEAGARTRRWQDGRLSTYMASIAIGVAALLVFLHEVVLRVRWSP